MDYGLCYGSNCFSICIMDFIHDSLTFSYFLTPGNPIFGFNFSMDIGKPSQYLSSSMLNILGLTMLCIGLMDSFVFGAASNCLHYFTEMPLRRMLFYRIYWT
jgi:hypothetical protein